MDGDGWGCLLMYLHGFWEDVYSIYQCKSSQPWFFFVLYEVYLCITIDHYSELLTKNCKEVGARFRHSSGLFQRRVPQRFRCASAAQVFATARLSNIADEILSTGAKRLRHSEPSGQSSKTVDPRPASLLWPAMMGSSAVRQPHLSRSADAPGNRTAAPAARIFRSS
jgi:hypothetical protein